ARIEIQFGWVMAKVRFGIDQVTAWVLAVAVGCAVFGAGYFLSKLGARAAEDGEHGLSHGEELAVADVAAAPQAAEEEAPIPMPEEQPAPAASPKSAYSHAP